MNQPEEYPQLLSLAVHEFRTPASVVGGYLRMLQRDVGDPLTDRQRKMIDDAEKSCARLVALIAELSDIAKLDAGLIALTRQPVDVFALVSDVAAHVREAKDRGVGLEIRGSADGAATTGDAVRLRNAFEAIFRAVLRERAGPCTVVADRRVDTRDGQRRAIVVIADDGDVETSYDSVPAAFDEKRGGVGLALPLARRVIEGHGGRLWSPVPRREDDPMARTSAIIAIPLTESTR